MRYVRNFIGLVGALITFPLTIVQLVVYLLFDPRMIWDTDPISLSVWDFITGNR